MELTKSPDQRTDYESNKKTPGSKFWKKPLALLITGLWFILLFAIPLGIVFFFAKGCSNFFDHPKSEKVSNSAYDNSVPEVEFYLKSNLKDPDSYESIHWNQVEKDGSGFSVRHMYRAKNSFGGYTIKDQIFYLTQEGNVYLVKAFKNQ